MPLADSEPAEPRVDDERAVPIPSAADPRRAFARVLRWSFPLVSVGLALLAQVLVPRILQLRFSEGEYTAYVAIAAVVAYVGLGEGGVLISVMRELSALHGAGDRAGFVAEARRSRRMFYLVGVVGGAIAAVALGSVTGAATASWPQAERAAVMLGAAACIAGASLELSFGSYHTALLYSTDRVLTAQLTGVAVSLVPVSSLVVALLATRELAQAIWAQGIAMAVVAAARGWHARRIFRLEARGVEVVPPRARLRKVVGSGVLVKLGEVLQTASYPHLLTVLSAAVVPAAVPARTYANAVRLVTQRLVDVLQMHVTRGMASGEAGREQARRQYAAVSVFLTAIHLAQLGMAALLVEPVFALWLPNQLAVVHACLPGLLVEQALLSAALPTTILLIAGDRLSAFGAMRLAGVPIGLGAMALAVGSSSYAALGVGLALSAVPLFAFGCWIELGALAHLAPARRIVVARYALAALAASLSAFHGRWPLVTGVAVAVCGVALLPWSAARLWRMLRA